MSQNLARVDSLIDLHEFLEDLASKVIKGRPEVDDILRSAVVLLHASLEDFLRSVAAKHLPRTDSELLGRIPLAGTSRAAKYTLRDLVAHRGKQIDAVLDESIDQWLHQHSFNHCDDVVAMLKHIGIPPDYCQDCFSELDAMISRRHRIVHNADRPKQSDGNDASEVTPIGRDEVEQWRQTVQQFMQKVLYQLQFVVGGQSEKTT